MEVFRGQNGRVSMNWDDSPEMKDYDVQSSNLMAFPSNADSSKYFVGVTEKIGDETYEAAFYVGADSALELMLLFARIYEELKN